MTLLIAGLLAVLFSGCATVSTAPYAGRTELRAGLVLHSNPNFSFQLPDGWRMATASDWMSFGANQRVLSSLNEYGRREFQRAGAEDLKRYPIVLISTRGAWVNVVIERNSGTQFRSGYVFNDAEKQNLWQVIESPALKQSAPTDKPKLALQGLDVIDYGRNPVVRLRFQREDRRGSFLWTAFGFFGDQNVVTIYHVGIPDDPSEGLPALEASLASFRFD